MPRGARVKVKKMMPKGSEEDSNVLNDMFEQMTGSQNADSSIIVPKLLRLNSLLQKFSKIYTMLLNFGDFVNNFQEYKSEFDEIKTFIENIQNITTIESEFTKEKLKMMDATKVNNLYKTLKGKSEVQSIIITSGNLKKHKRYLEDKNNLKDDFIKREPGLSLNPLSFTQLNFKLLWASGKLTNMAKKYILSILNHTYVIGHEMYEVITSPDIDIKKFSKVLIDNIDKMKKTIPRCDKAFNIIKNSVELLEGNFKNYYKNSVEAENPSIIVESFIIDVSMSQKANASITGQFRRIIMFMKKQAANNKDPRVKKLFKILNSQFDLMAQKTGVTPVDDDETKDEPQDETKDEPHDETKDETKDEPQDETKDEPQDEPQDEESKDDETKEIEGMLSNLMGSLMPSESTTEQNESDDSLSDLENPSEVNEEPEIVD
jgi:hypothetical protein